MDKDKAHLREKIGDDALGEDQEGYLTQDMIGTDAAPMDDRGKHLLGDHQRDGRHEKEQMGGQPLRHEATGAIERIGIEDDCQKKEVACNDHVANKIVCLCITTAHLNRLAVPAGDAEHDADTCNSLDEPVLMLLTAETATNTGKLAVDDNDLLAYLGILLSLLNNDRLFTGRIAEQAELEHLAIGNLIRSICVFVSKEMERYGTLAEQLTELYDGHGKLDKHIVVDDWHHDPTRLRLTVYQTLPIGHRDEADKSFLL